MSSISDNKKYPNFCKQAALDNDVFATFKSNATYNEILEHVTYEEGGDYISQFASNTTVINKLADYQINDKLGGPKCYNYLQYGIFSPTTLRYIKILSDLSQLDLNNKSIIEIGAGYGGQYTILKQLFKPKKYTFIDLEDVLLLIKKYVITLKQDDIDLEYVACGNITTDILSDLVISNYAFSECNADIQDIYIKHILKHAKHGYMIYNNFNGYSHNDLAKILNESNKHVRINKEIPQTHPNNVILTW